MEIEKNISPEADVDWLGNIRKVGFECVIVKNKFRQEYLLCFACFSPLKLRNRTECTQQIFTMKEEVWKGPLKVIWSKSLMRPVPSLQLDQALKLYQMAQGIVKLSFQYHWGWRYLQKLLFLFFPLKQMFKSVLQDHIQLLKKRLKSFGLLPSRLQQLLPEEEYFDIPTLLHKVLLVLWLW